MNIHKNVFNAFFFVMILIELIQEAYSLDPKNIIAGQELIGSISKKDSYMYYTFKITEDFRKSKDALQLVAKPYGTGKDFSDPDIYISKSNKLPTIKDHDWFSENFGMDIITIEPDEIEESVENLTIGITCETGDCKFKFMVQYEKELEIAVNSQISMRLNKDQDTIFKFRVRKQSTTPPFNMMQVSIWSPNFAEYSVIMQKNKGASSTESVKFSPAWLGASAVLLENEELCDDCNYHLLIYPKSDHALFILSVDTGTDILDFKYGNMAFALAPSYRTICHRKKVLPSDTKLIMSALLFSGAGKLNIYATKDKTTDFSAPTYSYDLRKEIITPINKGDLGFNEGYLNFCLTSYYYTTSYTLNVYDEKDAYFQQLNNVLFNGLSTPGYLPGNGITKYSMVDTEKNTNITLTYNVKSGSAKIYGFICKFDCTVEKNFISQHKNELFYPELIIPNTNSTSLDTDDASLSTNSTNYIIRIPSQDNTCELTESSYSCLPIVVVDCESEEECIFSITAQYGHNVIQLKNGKQHHNVISYGAEEYYYFQVNEDVDRITVLLNSLNGDADLFMSQTNKKPNKDDYTWTSVQETFTPDIIMIEKSEFRPSIKGEYYIGIFGESFSSYNLVYYTTTKENNNKNQTTIDDDTHIDTQHVGIELKNGYTSKGFLAKGEYFRVYELDKDDNEDPVKFFLTSLKSSLKLYIYTSTNFIENFDKNNKLPGYEKELEKYQNKIEGLKKGEVYPPPPDFEEFDLFENFDWSSDDDINELVITSQDKKYKKTGIYYAVVCRKYPTAHKNATFYLTAVESDFAIVLQESLPQIISLKESYLNTQNFLTYLYKGQKGSTLNINTLKGKVRMDIFGPYNNSTLKCGSFCKSLISFDQYCDGSVMESCAVMAVISEREEKKFSKFSISLKSGDSSIPEPLNIGYIKTDSIQEGDTHYYSYSIQNVTDTTYAYFTFEEGVIDVLARLVTYKSNITTYPQSYDEEELYNVEYSYRGGRAIALYHIDMNDCFLDPSHPTETNSLDCMLLITIRGSYSFNKDKNIYYTIDYSGTAYMIPTDTPIYGEVSFVNYDFFRFEIPENLELFSLSLSHTSSSTTLMLNKGEEIPIMGADWIIGDWRPEIIEITSNDQILKDKKELLPGIYTGAIYADTNTTYNLYINTHPKRVEEVDNFSISKCKVSKGESCYFTYFYSLYDTFFDFFASDVTKEYKDLIVVSHLDYQYGDAVVYAKIVNEDLDTYDKVLPDEKHYDASSEDQNSRNFLKLIIPKDDERLKPKKKDKNSEAFTNTIILFTVKCINDCDLQFMVREIKDNFLYMDPTRENIIYSPSYTKSFLQYYMFYINYNYLEPGNSEKKDQIMKFNLLSGKASIALKVYDSLDDIYQTSWGNDDPNKENKPKGVDFLTKKGRDIESFALNKDNKHWISTIDSENMEKFIIAIIDTKEEDVGFSVSLEEKRKWQKINFKFLNLVNAEEKFNSFQTKYLFFPYHDKIGNVTLNINTEYKDALINVYGSYYSMEKFSMEELEEIRKKKESTKNFEDIIPVHKSFEYVSGDIVPPDAEKNDFKAENARGGISYLHIPKKENYDKDKERLFVILSIQVNITDSIDNKQLVKQNTPLFTVNLEKFEEKPKEEMTAWMVEVSENQKFVDMISKKEAKIFHLTKLQQDNDFLVIRIDRCDNSELSFYLTDKIVFDNANSKIKDKKDNLHFKLETRDTRYLLEVETPREDYFLIVTRSPIENNDKQQKDNKEEDSEVFSTSFYILQYNFYNKGDVAHKTSLWTTSPILEYETDKNSVTITYDIPEVVKNDPRRLEARYKIYVTRDKYEYRSFHSLCYLNSSTEKHSFYDNKRGSFTFDLEKGNNYIGVTASINGDTFVYNPIEVVIAKGIRAVAWPVISKILVYF